MTNKTVWIIDDDRSIRFVLQKALEQAQINVRSFELPNTLLDTLAECSPEERPDVLISDISMPEMDGFALLKEIRYDHKDLPVIIMTAHSDLDNAVSAFQRGAFEYLPKPFDLDYAIELVQRALGQNDENKAESADKPSDKPNAAPLIIGNAPAMQEVFRIIGRLAQSSINVMVTGASGTGKELVAKAIHETSPRAKKAFIALNMAAIPKDLIESELFGHEKGAFTGATTQRAGRFEQANGGTLFLDEIGDMPLEAQTRLLRVLQEHNFYRVGGKSAIDVDVRIVAATHQNLEALVKTGRFREDLYHRLNVIRLQLPLLSERKEDIPQLTAHFMRLASEQLQIKPKQVSGELLQALSQYQWPGNVRQLQNTCQWLTVMTIGDTMLPQDLPAEIIEALAEDAEDKLNAEKSSSSPKNAVHSAKQTTELAPASQSWQALLSASIAQQLAAGQTDILEKTSPAFERVHIEAALQFTAGKKQEAAQLLGWGRNTLTRKMKELAITEQKK